MYLPFRFAGALVSDDANVTNFAYTCLCKELVYLFLVRLQVNSCNQYGAVIPFSLFRLSFSFL